MSALEECASCGARDGTPSCSACGAEYQLRLVGEVDRAHAQNDLDQTLSDHDQTVSDGDQTASDADQAGSERDQQSADEDQDAADDDLAAGSDAATHARTSQARERSGRDRRAVSDQRAVAASHRFETARHRDRTADERDRDAAARDARSSLLDLPDGLESARHELLARAAADRLRAANDRASAANDRAAAALDRDAAASECAEAARIMRESAHATRLAATDELTGTWTRTFGLRRISDELERAHRSGGQIVLVFLDVDGLKRINDRDGHLAGDDLLRGVGEALRRHLRPYDVTVRYGGDEFICAMSNLSPADATARFTVISQALRHGHTFTVGVASSEADDALWQLIARADADLLRARRTR